MTQEQHPITPSPELVRQWAKTCSPYDVPADHIATQAARWGADQELEACYVLMAEWGLDSAHFMACRRPKPPSLKEQALKILDREHEGWRLADCDWVTLRLAVKALPDD